MKGGGGGFTPRMCLFRVLWRNDYQARRWAQPCKPGDEKGLNFFLSCVSKQRDLFERHLDYRVKELLFKPLKLWGMGDARVKTERGDEEWEQLKAGAPPGASVWRRRSCPAFDKSLGHAACSSVPQPSSRVTFEQKRCLKFPKQHKK